MKKLINPFVYLSGGATMAWGAVGMAAMIVVAWCGGLTFRGVVSAGMGDLALWQLALQQVAGWGVFATLLYGAARGLSKSKVRAVDIFGNQLMARLPLLLVLSGSALPVIRRTIDEIGSMTTDQIAGLSLPVLTIFGFAALGVLVWFFAWSYQGYAIAANLRGWRAGASYIVCYLVAEVIASWCTGLVAGW